MSRAPTGDAPVASVRDLTVSYRQHVAGKDQLVTALQRVTVDVMEAETLGVVGESGAGKTTLGRVLLGLVRPTHGTVVVCGQPLNKRNGARRLRGRLQVVPQNPDWSLNPHLRIWRSVAEPLAIARVPRRERRQRVDEMLEQVGLSPVLGNRRPHELSGGQRQRVAIARAVITKPELIVFDEAVTALDASVQTQVLNLMRELQREAGFASVFISHDIAAVRYVSDRIAVAFNGELVEVAPVERFYGRPEHPYSRSLLAASGVTTVHA